MTIEQRTSGKLDKEFVREQSLKQGETVFDKSVPGRKGIVFPSPQVPEQDFPPSEFLRQGDIGLPQITEPEVVRHYTRLSRQNFSIGQGFYPLGSCTMKYNPRRNEEIVSLPGFSEIHPEQPEETVQGTMEVLYRLQRFLTEITGMDATTLSPMGGAHGEFTGVLMIKAFHQSNGEGEKRRKMLIPKSAHGTNPATAAMAGYEIVEIESDEDGNLDREDFLAKVQEFGDSIAGMMITQPNPLGLFDQNAIEASNVLHEVGALVYGDGANMNALLGKLRPRDLGIDVMHINTHKALTTPHGGGGPGAGPVMAIGKLAEFMPGPVVEKDEETGMYKRKTPEHSIGRVSGNFGNVTVLIRAFAYLRTMGEEGLRRVSENAVLNANYIKAELLDTFPIQHGRRRKTMHEVVLRGRLDDKKLTTDIAKRLIDYGFHPPTVHFPLIADQALMIEPTETETLEGLKIFIEVMKIIAREAKDDPELLHSAPHFSPVGRLDEVTAARKPILVWQSKEG